MSISVAPSPRLRSLLPVLVMLGLCLYFSFYLVFGPRGYLALDRLENDYSAQRAELDVLQTARKQLESDVHLMHPDSLDADMADEQARRILGYTKNDEIVIYLDTRKS